MEVYKATLSDLDELATLFDEYRIFYEQPSSIQDCRKYLEERLNRKEADVFIARELNQNAAGFTLLYPSFSSVSRASIYILNDLFVRDGYRKQGIATALLKEAGVFAKERGAIRLQLETGTDNIRAQKLYEKEGWVQDQGYLHYSLKL